MINTPETIWATTQWDWFTFDSNPRIPANQYTRTDIADARVKAAVEAEKAKRLDQVRSMQKRISEQRKVIRRLEILEQAHWEFVNQVREERVAIRAGVPE